MEIQATSEVFVSKLASVAHLSHECLHWQQYTWRLHRLPSGRALTLTCWWVSEFCKLVIIKWFFTWQCLAIMSFYQTPQTLEPFGGSIGKQNQQETCGPKSHPLPQVFCYTAVFLSLCWKTYRCSPRERRIRYRTQKSFFSTVLQVTFISEMYTWEHSRGAQFLTLQNVKPISLRHLVP